MCNELLEQEETVSKEESNTPTNIPVTCVAGEDPQRLFIAIINEECQKRRLPLPNYECFGETCGGIMKFRCRVSGFSTFPDFRSDAHPSKRAAKNEDAKCIYEWMLKQGTEKKELPLPLPVLPGTQHLDISADFVPFENENYGEYHDDNDPKRMIIPYVMHLLTFVSKTCYSHLSPLEGVNEMLEQWKEFQEWQEFINHN